MSIPQVAALLLLSLFCVVPLSAQDSTSSSLVATPPQTKLLDNPFRNAPADPFKLHLSPAPKTNSANPFSDFSSGKTYVVYGATPEADLNPEGDVTCLSMRTYKVKRDDPRSDAVRPAGYSTCQPTKRFGVKSAVEKSGVVLH